VNAFAVRVSGGKTGIAGSLYIEVFIGTGDGFFLLGLFAKKRIEHDDTFGVFLELPRLALARFALLLAEMFVRACAARKLLADRLENVALRLLLRLRDGHGDRASGKFLELRRNERNDRHNGPDVDAVLRRRRQEEHDLVLLPFPKNSELPCGQQRHHDEDMDQDDGRAGAQPLEHAFALQSRGAQALCCQVGKVYLGSAVL